MSASVGQELRQERQAKNLTLEQVSRATRIRVHHLEALESGNLELLPSFTQARGFLRTYAGFLGIKPEPLLDRVTLGRQPGPRVLAGTTPPVHLPQGEGPAEIFQEIGQSLRQHRELLGLQLEEIERQTFLRQHYLVSIEAGDFGSLPSPVQGRGMLKNYAGFLGLDPEPLLLKFAEGLQNQHASRRGNSEVQNIDRPGLKPRGLLRFLSLDLILGSAIMVGLLVFVIWAVGRVTNLQASQSPDATAPSIVDILIPSPTNTPTPAPPTPTPTLPEGGTQLNAEETGATATPDLLLPLESDDPVLVYVVAVQRAWMRVTVDGVIAFEGRVVPGSAYPFSGRESIELLTGSGSALTVIYNQEDQGPLGLFGQVVERIYTPAGVLTPTPEASPTPAETPTGEPTPTSDGIPAGEEGSTG